MIVKTIDEHIEITPGVAGGKPRIVGRRIKVQDIAIWHERIGLSVDEIATEHDLSLADIHAALSYYFDHREQIDRDIAEGDAFVEELKRRTPSKLAEKLQELQGRGSGG
jgi:uncharacterized protein (DUF433 family)